MKKNGILNSLPFRLLLALVIGIVVGLFLNKNDTSAVSVALLNIIVTVKYIVGQFIGFCIPLIIIGFIAVYYKAWQQCVKNTYSCSYNSLCFFNRCGILCHRLRLYNTTTYEYYA